MLDLRMVGVESAIPRVSVLVVEDDRKLQELLKEYLISQSFGVAVVGEGREAIEYISRNPPDIVVLDIMLPGVDGLEVCRRIRPSFRGGIVMLTALKSDMDQVVGLEIGADDYVTKPVEPRVLVARIRSILRRLPQSPTNRPATPIGPELQRHSVGPLRVDRMAREAWVEDKPVKLTGVEFEILWLLCDNVGAVVTREALYQEIRGIPYDGVDRSIDIHVSRIRRKLRSAGLDADHIKSIRGSGYTVVISR
ncbi:MAG: response regulator transcription factor [Proteobacteria bacterium]|nr:response regulator transcription factor [Pseudomonadota bacterium]